jgi:hypothetical protein
LKRGAELHEELGAHELHDVQRGGPGRRTQERSRPAAELDDVHVFVDENTGWPELLEHLSIGQLLHADERSVLEPGQRQV